MSERLTHYGNDNAPNGDPHVYLTVDKRQCLLAKIMDRICNDCEMCKDLYLHSDKCVFGMAIKKLAKYEDGDAE